MRNTILTDERAEILDRGPLQYAPQNELGVVFLFSSVAPKFRLRVDHPIPGWLEVD